jgi:hypothetical protein
MVDLVALQALLNNRWCPLKWILTDIWGQGLEFRPCRARMGLRCGHECGQLGGQPIVWN